MRHDTSSPSATASRRSLPLTPPRLSHTANSRAQHRDAGMDRAAGVERVVEIQRMTHAGIQQRGLRRRQADAAQQDAAFLPPAPAARSPQRARRSPANRCRRACSRRYRECRGGRTRRRSPAGPRNPCGKHAGRAPKRDRRSLSSFHANHPSVRVHCGETLKQGGGRCRQTEPRRSPKAPRTFAPRSRRRLSTASRPSSSLRRSCRNRGVRTPRSPPRTRCGSC